MMFTVVAVSAHEALVGPWADGDIGPFTGNVHPASSGPARWLSSPARQAGRIETPRRPRAT